MRSLDSAHAAILEFNREIAVHITLPPNTLTRARNIARSCRVRFDDVCRARDVIQQDESDNWVVMCAGTHHALIQFMGVIGESEIMESLVTDYTTLARTTLVD